MKKVIQILIPCVILIALILPFLLVEKDVEITMFEKVFEPYVSEDMQIQDIKILKNIYEIKDSDMESYISYGPISYINVDEITLIRQSDAIKRKHLYEQVLAHIETQKKSFEGYGVEQTKLLKNAKVIEKGKYVICIVSKDADAILNEFNIQFEGR